MDHAARVDALFERCAEALAAGALPTLFERTFQALLQRTQLTLGDVTLAAIVDRVLYNAAEIFPVFSALRVEPDVNLDWQRFREQAESVAAAELLNGVRFVLVEYLTVVGNLTAEILTPALHAELAHVAPARLVKDQHDRGDERL